MADGAGCGGGLEPGGAFEFCVVSLGGGGREGGREGGEGWKEGRNASG